MGAERTETSRIFVLGLTLVFLLVAGFGIANHEMGRDELQAWLIARDSATLPELLRHMKYEGHPAVWFLLLFPLTHLRLPVWSMQAVHLAIATATAALIAWRAPFSRVQRVLLVLGYFFVWQYAVLSRDYAIGVLLILLCCALYPWRERHSLAVGLCLATLANTSVFGLIIGAGFATILAVEHFLPSDGSPSMLARHRWTAIGLYLVGAVIAARQMHPPPDTGYAMGWYTAFNLHHLRECLRTIPRALVPRVLFEPFPQLDAAAPNTPCWLLSAGLLAWSGVQLARRPTALLFALVATGGLLLFYYTKLHSGVGGIHHFGFLFIALIAALWLARNAPTPARPRDLPLTLVLVWQAATGLYAIAREYLYVESAGQETAAFLVREGLDRLPLVGDKDFATTTVVGYANIRAAYYPRGGRWGSYVVWDTARLRPITDRQVFDAADSLADDLHRDVVVLVNRSLDTTMDHGPQPLQVATFTDADTKDENFYVFLVHPPERP